MPYHTAHNVEQLKEVGVKQFIARFPELKIGQKWLPHSRACIAVVAKLYPVGVRLFQTGNEPNDVTAWGSHGWDYTFYMRYVMRDVETYCKVQHMEIGVGKDIGFILPPLSYAPALWNMLSLWQHAFTSRPDKDHLIPALSEYHQYAGANCYWQYPKYLLDGSYGMSFGDVQNWARLPVHVVEYGYSGSLVGVQGQELWGQMAKDYPLYVQETEKRGAKSAHVFLVGGTKDWAGLSIPGQVAQALGATQP